MGSNIDRTAFKTSNLGVYASGDNLGTFVMLGISINITVA